MQVSNQDLKAILSALADDEAGDVGVRRILAEMKTDPQAIRESWGAYHLMRASLAHGSTGLCSEDFLARVQSNIRAAGLSQAASVEEQADRQPQRHHGGAWQQDGRSDSNHAPQQQTLSALWAGLSQWKSLAAASFMLVAVAIVAVVVTGSQQSGMTDFAQHADPKSAAQETLRSPQQPQTDGMHIASLGSGIAGNSGRGEDGSSNSGIGDAGNRATASSAPASVAATQADSARDARGEAASIRIQAGIHGTVSQRFVADRLNSYTIDHSNRRLTSVGFTPFMTIVTDFRARSVDATSSQAQYYGQQE